MTWKQLPDNSKLGYPSYFTCYMLRKNIDHIDFTELRKFQFEFFRKCVQEPGKILDWMWEDVAWIRGLDIPGDHGRWPETNLSYEKWQNKTERPPKENNNVKNYRGHWTFC